MAVEARRRWLWTVVGVVSMLMAAAAVLWSLQAFLGLLVGQSMALGASVLDDFVRGAGDV